MEWLRYEMEGLNHWRIDEKYDSNGGGIGLDDAFRIQRYYVNGPGQLGQIVKARVFTYPNNTTNQSSADTDYYYGYDVLGNVSVISGSNGAEADQFEQDAFGNQVEGSWSGGLGDTITERLTTKQFDADLGPNGLYYFNARWYDPLAGVFWSMDKYSTLSDGKVRKYEISLNCPTMLVDPSGWKEYHDLGSGYKISDKCIECIAAEILSLGYITEFGKDMLEKKLIDAFKKKYLPRELNKWKQSSKTPSTTTQFASEISCMYGSGSGSSLNFDCSDKVFTESQTARCADSASIMDDAIIYYKMFDYSDIPADPNKPQDALQALTHTMIHEKAHKCGWKIISNTTLGPKDHDIVDPWMAIPCAHLNCNNHIPFYQWIKN